MLRLDRARAWETEQSSNQAMLTTGRFGSLSTARKALVEVPLRARRALVTRSARLVFRVYPLGGSETIVRHDSCGTQERLRSALYGRQQRQRWHACRWRRPILPRRLALRRAQAQQTWRAARGYSICVQRSRMQKRHCTGMLAHRSGPLWFCRLPKVTDRPPLSASRWRSESNGMMSSRPRHRPSQVDAGPIRVRLRRQACFI